MKSSSLIMILMCVKWPDVTGAWPRRESGSHNMEQSDRNKQREVRAAVFDASASLALKLDQKLSKAPRHQNIILSPSCLQMAIAMVLLASEGRTSRQIAELLGSYDGQIDSSDILDYIVGVHELLKLIFESNDEKKSRNALVQTQHSSGIFIQSGYKVQNRYLDDSKYLYNSDVFPINFAGDSRATQRSINSWVRNKTRGKISKILENPVDPSTRAMIFSTLYFKGEWERHFTELEGRKPFTTQTGETIEVSMLYATAEYPFFADRLGMQMIGLPYKQEEVWMYVILPGRAGFKDLKRSLTPELLNILIQRMEPQRVNVIIPKMKLTKSMSLKEPFEALGLRDLFDRKRAELPGLSDTETIDKSQSNPFKIWQRQPVPRRQQQVGSRLYVSDIVHAVEISVNEVGTEAGAATAVGFANKLDASESEFRVNRSFVFFIRNNRTKSILFWGSIVDPR